MFPSWLWKAPLIQPMFISPAKSLSLSVRQDIVVMGSTEQHAYYMYFSPFSGTLRYVVALEWFMPYSVLSSATDTIVGNSNDDRKEKICQQTCHFLPSKGLNIFPVQKYCQFSKMKPLISLLGMLFFNGSCIRLLLSLFILWRKRFLKP